MDFKKHTRMALYVEDIYKTMAKDSRTMKEMAHRHATDDAVDRYSGTDMTTQAWTRAVIDALIMNGYKIKKEDNEGFE